MQKLSDKEASRIYGGIAFAAFLTLVAELAVSITAIIKMSNSSTGSIKQNGKSTEYKWENDASNASNKSPAFFGY